MYLNQIKSVFISTFSIIILFRQMC